MNELQIFKYNDNEVRTAVRNGELWWVLKDVCGVLGLSNPSMIADRLDEDEKSKLDPKSGLGSRSNEQINIINESGLYNVIIRSDKPEAKHFKRWVTHEVLPSIRKHGVYMTPEKIEEVLFNPDTIIRIATELKTERAAREQLEIEAAENKPKVAFADAVSTSNSTLSIAQS